MHESEQTPHLADLARRTLELLGVPEERRQESRWRLTFPLQAKLGRCTGQLINLSMKGARLRHAHAVCPCSDAVLSFHWGDETFKTSVRVLATGLRPADGQALFESRMRFYDVPQASQELLERVIATLTDQQLRKWVDNLMGEPNKGWPATSAASGLLRYRFLDGQWVTRPAKVDEPPPRDGFVVPASMDESELKVLCAAYRRANRDGQQLLRLFTQAAIAA